MEEPSQDIKAIPCENCPKGVKDGMMFVKDGKTYCCGDCHQTGKRDNTCEFC
ncbi:MAG: hypothetical protein WD970_01090 [Patescibacteria group bacterium]